MPNRNENFNQEQTETFYHNDFEIPEAPDTWDLQDFEVLLQDLTPGKDRLTHQGLPVAGV